MENVFQKLRGEVGLSRKLASVLLFTLFANFFFFHRLGTLAISLFALAFFTLVLGIFASRNFWKISKLNVLGFFLFLLGAVTFLVFRSQGFTQVILIFFTLSLLCVFTYLAYSEMPFLQSITELFFVPFRNFAAYIKGSFSAIGYFISRKNKLETKSLHFHSIIVGLVFAVPVLLILISILSKADPIYASFVNKIFAEDFFKNFFENKLVQRTILTLIVFAVTVPLAFLKARTRFESPLKHLPKFSLVHEVEVVMILVAITILPFLFVEWPYVFANVAFEADLSQFGVATYSEYVQKGFGELLKASLFIFAIVWGGLIIFRNKRHDQRTILPYIQIFVIAELVVFIISIFRRVMLYQTYHGLSLGRIYGAVFLVWVLGLALTLAIRHFKDKSFIKGEAVFTALIVLFLGFFNAEEYIAKNNPPTVNKKVDYVYLSKMSTDGTLGWQKAFEYAESILGPSTLLEAPLISFDQRREIAYSGMIVDKLLVKYHSLVHEYGTFEEVIDYYAQVLTYRIEDLDMKIQALRDKNDASVSAYKIGEIENQKALTESALDNLKAGRIDKFALILPRFNTSVTYKEKTLMPSFYYIYGEGNYYYPVYYNPVQIVKGLDRVFTWNASRQQGYEFLRDDIGLTKLLALQRQYFLLYDKVVNQPEGEKEYEFDISLNTPFLAND